MAYEHHCNRLQRFFRSDSRRAAISCTAIGAVLGSLAGALAAILASALHPTSVVISAATVGSAIGIRRGRSSPADLFLVRVLLVGCLGALAATESGPLGPVPSLAVGLLGVLTGIGAALSLKRAIRAERRLTAPSRRN
jgi:hypothetical protein